LQHVMVRKVVMGQEPLSLQQATDMLRKAKVGKLPIVDTEGRLVSLVARSNTKKLREFPTMLRNISGQLMVGAAVGVGAPDDWERAAELIGVGTDVLYIDGSLDAGDRQLQLIERLKTEYPETDLIAGPACSCREAKRLVEAGADAVVIGDAVAPGGDRLGGVAPIGRPEATAVYEVANYVRLNYRLPTLAGSARNVGQVLKALALGASTVLLDDLIAGTDEAPGMQVLEGGTWMKLHNGTVPLQSMRHRLPPKHLPEAVPHGVSAMHHCQGSVKELVPYILQGLRCGFQDLGISNLPDLHKALDDGELLIETRSDFAAAYAEAGSQSIQRAEHPEVMPYFVSIPGRIL